MKPRTLFTTWQWATMIGGLVAAATTVTAWALGTFQAKTDFQRFEDHLDKRLDRIELKIDRSTSIIKHGE